MSRKSKGIQAERAILHKFWKKGWSCVRVAGSGSMSYPSPDLLAGNNLRKIAIESKCISSKSFYFEQREIDELKDFCTIFGAEAWIAIKFPNRRWCFFSIEDLNETEKGFSITQSICERRALNFDEMIGVFG